MRRPRPSSSRRTHAAAPRISRMPRPVVVRPPSRLAELPPALFHSILAFVVSDDRSDLALPKGTMRLELQDIALVSKAWNAHAGELMSQLHMGRVLCNFKRATRQELAEIRVKFSLIGPCVRELRLALSPPSMYSTTAMDEWLLRLTRAAETVLARMPRLELLDLRHYCAPSHHLAMIVRAAAKHCPKLQSLLLPADMSPNDPPRPGARALNPVNMQPMMNAVFDAMQRWCEHGNTGLRQLRLPTRQSSNRCKHSTEYLNQVCAFAPGVELLDGYAWMPGNVCRDQWIVDRATWERFCATCSQLRQFDWNIAPFATDYFEIFGKYAKPKLTELVLTTQRVWDWDLFRREVGIDEAAAIRTSGFGKATKSVHAVLKACPALKVLFIHVHSPIDRRGSTGPDDPFANPKNPMNQELFGDAFWTAVAQHCPRVHQVNLISDDMLAESFAPNREPIMAFTDASLKAMASLRDLTLVALKAVNVSGDGLFDLINSPHNQSPEQRNISLFVGDSSGPTQQAFYRAIEGLLQRLADRKEPLACAGKRIALRVSNGSTKLETRKYSTAYLRRLKKLLQSVRAKFPGLRLRIAVTGYTHSAFERITTVELLTSHRAVPPDPTHWEQLPRHTLVDGVFVLEEYLDDGYGDDGYDDFGEGDYGDYGDYENENGFYGMGGYHFFNGLQLDDSYHDDYY